MFYADSGLWKVRPISMGVVRGVRTLIMLMRGADVQIDYGSLARDLYLIQLPSQRGKSISKLGS